MCILGILLIAVPNFSLNLFGVLCGAALIAFGIIELVGYFSKDLYRLAFQYDLAFGVLVIMLFHPTELIHFMCIALGISFLSDGLFKIQIAIDAKKIGIYKWWLIFALAVLTVIFGAVLVVRPTLASRVLAILMGIAMLCEGIMNIITVVTAVKIIKHQQADVIVEEVESL